MNMGVQIFDHVSAFSSFGYRPRSAIAGLDDSSVFNFSSYLYSRVGLS
jgi:hypothetical protein